MSEHTDILIVGAGPAGLVLACDLARRGVAFRLIERAPGPHRNSRGKGLQPRSLELFDDLGVADAILADAAPYPIVRAYAGDKAPEEHRMWETRTPSPHEPYPNTMMSPQWRTEQRLRERLAELGGAVEFGVELAGFRQDAAEVIATLRTADGVHTIHARYLVGADGGRSFVRKTLGVDFAGETLAGPQVLFGDVTVEGLDRDAYHVWPRADGLMAGLCPMAGEDVFQLTLAVPDGVEPDLSEAGAQALFQTFSNRPDLRLREPTGLSIYRPSLRLAHRFRVGRVFLAGDAAHVHPPTGGQGLNTSIQDAYNLGWKLAAVLAGADETLLDSYEAERRPVAAGVLTFSSGLARDATEGGVASQKRGREGQQLDLSYRDPENRDPALQAGDRAPDAPCRDAGDRSVRLFDLFRGPHFTQIGAPGAVRPDADLEAKLHVPVRTFVLDEDVVDDHGHIAGAYGDLTDRAVLVRPDGYVATATPSTTGTVSDSRPPMRIGSTRRARPVALSVST
jgi:2-polyprenyl-6-methoxyphenol hydroxylase-like FAD-dependent oxidoreductase